MCVHCKAQAWLLGKSNHCLSSLSHPSTPPGKEPGSGADICELHLQLLPGRSPELFRLLGPDTGLFPSTSGEPDHCGHSCCRCPGLGSPGWPFGAGLPSAVYTVRRRDGLCVFVCVRIHVLNQTGNDQYFLRLIKIIFLIKILIYQKFGSFLWNKMTRTSQDFIFPWQDRKVSQMSFMLLLSVLYHQGPRLCIICIVYVICVCFQCFQIGCCNVGLVWMPFSFGPQWQRIKKKPTYRPSRNTTTLQWNQTNVFSVVVGPHTTMD